MRLEILNFKPTAIYWFLLDIRFFTIWIETEKWWSHGNEFVIGIRFGKNEFEKRWNNG